MLIYSNINVTCKNIIEKQSNIQKHDRAVLLICVFSLGDAINLNWLDIDMFSLLVLLQQPPRSQFFRTFVALKQEVSRIGTVQAEAVGFSGILLVRPYH